jgi:hypothetical protein
MIESMVVRYQEQSQLSTVANNAQIAGNGLGVVKT